MDSCYWLGDGHLIDGFTPGWLEALDAMQHSGRLDAEQAPDYRQFVVETADWPVAFSTNTRPGRVLILPAGVPVSIDFDHLILAPFGYDLARLIAALAIEHGPLPIPALQQAVDAYNIAARDHGGHLGAGATQMTEYICLHHTLTDPGFGGGDVQCCPEAHPRPPARKQPGGGPRNLPTQLDHEPKAVTYVREQAGLTQRRLAQACGVSPSLISEIESGTRNATPAMIGKLAAALNCPRVLLERKQGELSS